MFMSVTQPFDLANTLESGQVFRWRREIPFEEGEGNGGWYYGMISNNVVKIRHNSNDIEFFSYPDDEATMEPLLREFLRLGDDLETIYGSINIDQRINDAVTRYVGMRLLRQDPWECLISFICSSNSNISRIRTNMNDISRSFGHSLRLGEHLMSTFPTPQALAEVEEDRLRSLGLGFRAKYVSAVSRVVAEGRMDPLALRGASYHEALDVLTELPGVGDKVANCVMLFSLDKLESFPVDVWIRRAIHEWYSVDIAQRRGKPPSLKDMRIWAQEYFGPYAGYANQYLFHDRRLQAKS